MSNKISITKDKNSIYLHIEDLKECSFEVWETQGRKASLVRVKIPINEWNKIIKQWKPEKK